MIWTFTLLAGAMLSLWFSRQLKGAAGYRSPWLWIWVASLIVGLIHGYVGWPGAVVALGFGAAVFGYEQSLDSRRTVMAAIVFLLAGALMLHLLPGFRNPKVIDAVKFTPNAVPFTLYLNYDKTLVGLFLLGWSIPRASRLADWRAVLTAAPWSCALILGLMLGSLALGYVRFAPKFPAQSELWLGVNLLFTCTAEEALFRGLIQREFQRWFERRKAGKFLALAIAAVGFGLAHWAGGATYVALATLAGLGYGWIYQRSQRIEASILTHFALNSVHFFAFTYPALARISEAGGPA